MITPKSLVSNWDFENLLQNIGEDISNGLRDYIEAHSIKQLISVAYASERSSAAEQTNRKILNLTPLTLHYSHS